MDLANLNINFPTALSSYPREQPYTFGETKKREKN